MHGISSDAAGRLLSLVLQLEKFTIIKRLNG